MHLKVRLSEPVKKHLCGYHSSLAEATDAVRPDCPRTRHYNAVLRADASLEETMCLT